MNYLVAVLPNRLQVEEVYSVLKKEGLPLERDTPLPSEAKADSD